MSEIADLIKRLAGKQQMITLVATVKSVDTDQCTCEVEPVNGAAIRFDVRLRSVIDGTSSGLLILPTVGSTVIIAIIEDNIRNAFVIGYSEVDEIRLRGDAFGGLVKVEELTGKLNAIETLLNALIANYNTHVHSVTISALATPTPSLPTTSTEGDTLTLTTQADIENDTVKHG